MISNAFSRGFAILAAVLLTPAAFAQTREYVKRVVSLYAKYRFLYGPSPYEIPMVLNTKVAAEGPDF